MPDVTALAAAAIAKAPSLSTVVSKAETVASTVAADVSKVETVASTVKADASADLVALEARVTAIETYLGQLGEWCEAQLASVTGAVGKVEGDMHGALYAAEVKAASLKSAVVASIGSAEARLASIATHLGVTGVAGEIEKVVGHIV